MAIVELRQYTLRPGRRDAFVALFDAELVETQEACGMTVVGQFLDLDRPDRFVWLRQFADMEERREALESFYGGPVWATHGPAANDAMIEFDDVLLLRTLTPFVLPAERGGQAPDPLTIVVERRGTELAPGGDELGLLVSENAPNTFPRLPVREGEDVVVRVRRGPGGPGPDVLQVIRAQPTPRSLLR